MPKRRRYTPLQYARTFEELVSGNGQRLRRLYRRLFDKEPVFESSATEPLVREIELQEKMRVAIQHEQLKQEPEFHNKPGRPKGSKTKNRRKPPLPETKLTDEAKRQRRSRAKRARDN